MFHKLENLYQNLINSGVVPDMNHSEKKRVILTNLLSWLGLLLIGVFIVSYILLGVPQLIYISVINIIGYAIGLYFNSKGHYLSAKIFLFSVTNFAILSADLALGGGTGIHLIFIAVVAPCFMLFSLKERKAIMSVLMLTTTCMIASFSFQSLFGYTVEITQQELNIIYYISLGSSLFTVSSVSFSLIHQNFLSENKLSQTNTELKTSKKELIKMVEMQDKIMKRLENSKKNAEQASISKSEFLSAMSHEIRTPMNAVIGMTHLLIDENPRNDQSEKLDILRFSAENLLVLINDILDFNKIEEGKIEFEKTEFNLTNMITRIKKSLELKAIEKQIQLKLKLDSDLPQIVIGDSTRLSQVITNLTNNAVKFTEEGKVTIEVNLESSDNQHAKIHFSITDTGIGIPKDKIHSIFNRFSQANSSTTRKYGGSGLGLTITKSLLDLQNSTINVTSKEGEGSTFEFTLEFSLPERKSTDNIIKMNVNEFSSLKGIKVLLVEDNQVNKLLAKRFLEKWDIEVDTSENGIEAVEKVTANDYNLVLMDLQMPEMDGYEATKQIRNLDNIQKKNIPILALSASAMLTVRDKVHEAGMNDFITKPFQPADLYQKISQFALSA